MKQHLFQQYLTGIFHTEGNHGQAITDEYHVHTSMIGDVGAGKVMSRHHSYWFFLPEEGLKGIDGDGLAVIRQGRPQRRMRTQPGLGDGKACM